MTRTSYRLRSFSWRLHLRPVVVVIGVDEIDVAVSVEVINVHARLVVLIFFLRRLDDQDVAHLKGAKTFLRATLEKWSVSRCKHTQKAESRTSNGKFKLNVEEMMLPSTRQKNTKNIG